MRLPALLRGVVVAWAAGVALWSPILVSNDPRPFSFLAGVAVMGALLAAGGLLPVLLVAAVAARWRCSVRWPAGPALGALPCAALAAWLGVESAPWLVGTGLIAGGAGWLAAFGRRARASFGPEEARAG